MRLLALLAFAVVPLCAQAGDALEAFLRTEYHHSPEFLKELRYFDVRADLNGDGKPETIVYMSSPMTCGSGGCSLLILKSGGKSFNVMGRLTIVQTPIRVLNTSHNGWRDLAVTVRGGGIMPGYEAELRFDGMNYPGNPSVPPAIPLKKKIPGRILIGNDAFNKAKPLQ